MSAGSKIVPPIIVDNCKDGTKCLTHLVKHQKEHSGKTGRKRPKANDYKDIEVGSSMSLSCPPLPYSKKARIIEPGTGDILTEVNTLETSNINIEPEVVDMVIKAEDSNDRDMNIDGEVNTLVNFATEILNLKDKKSKKKKDPCCEGCATPNCLSCGPCLNKKWKKRCEMRKCIKQKPCEIKLKKL